jgi:muconolactone delta-isomerase
MGKFFAMDFLVHMEVTHVESSSEKWAALVDQEAKQARELAAAGVLRRLWRVPGRRANWGIWVAATADELHAAIASLPLFPYLSVTVHPLASHPNDPHRPLE